MIRIRDAIEEMQRQNPSPTGGSNQNQQQQPQNFGGGARRVLTPSRYVVRETDDMDGVDAGNAIRVQPGQSAAIVDARATSREGGMFVLAAGATDQDDTTYRLRVDDNTIVGGAMNRPLGSFQSPFSFASEFGAVIPVNDYIAYEVELSADASAAKHFVGSLHLEVL